MKHNAEHDNHNSSSIGIWAVIALVFGPAALTLAWVIHLATSGM